MELYIFSITICGSETSIQKHFKIWEIKLAHEFNTGSLGKF